MKATTWIATLAGVAALLGGFAALKQSRQLASARAEIAAALEQLDRARIEAARRPAAPAAPTLGEAEKLELIKLRGEVTRLRERKAELAGVAAENEKLRTKSAAGGTALPVGYLKRADAKFAGAATPQAALESFLWAIEREDTNALMQVLTEEGAAGFLEAYRAEGPEKFWKQVKVIPGLRMVGLREREDGTVMLSFEIMPGDPPQEMRARRSGDNTWRLSP